jgi:hypothetical protein
MADLYSKVGEHKMNAIKQKGKSDIEPIDYGEKIEAWYDQLVRMISMNPPKDYVRAICVTQDSHQIIKEITYQYYIEKNKEAFFINIFWI